MQIYISDDANKSLLRDRRKNIGGYPLSAVDEARLQRNFSIRQSEGKTLQENVTTLQFYTKELVGSDNIEVEYHGRYCGNNDVDLTIFSKDKTIVDSLFLTKREIDAANSLVLTKSEIDATNYVFTKLGCAIS